MCPKVTQKLHFGGNFRCFWSSFSQSQKLCLDCAGVGPLHVRSSRMTPVFDLFSLHPAFSSQSLIRYHFFSGFCRFWCQNGHQLGTPGEGREPCFSSLFAPWVPDGPQLHPDSAPDHPKPRFLMISDLFWRVSAPFWINFHSIWALFGTPFLQP